MEWVETKNDVPLCCNDEGWRKESNLVLVRDAHDLYWTAVYWEEFDEDGEGRVGWQQFGRDGYTYELTQVTHWAYIYLPKNLNYRRQP